MITGEPDDTRTQTPASLDGAIMTLRILVMAFCMSVGGFLVVGTLVLKSSSVRPSDDSTVRAALVGLAIAGLLASIVVRRRQFGLPKLEAVFATGGPQAFVRHLTTSTIVSSALAESAGVIGLALGLITRDPYYVYVLCACAFAGILFNFPRAAGWRGTYHYLATRFGSSARAAGKP